MTETSEEEEKRGTGVKLRFETPGSHLFCEKETAGCDLERRETTALEVI